MEQAIVPWECAIYGQGAFVVNLLRKALRGPKAPQFTILGIGAADVLNRDIQCLLHSSEIEAIAIVNPRGLLPIDMAAAVEHFSEAILSLYTRVSDLQNLELGHQFGIVYIPNILLLASSARLGLPAVLRFYLEEVLSPVSGLAIIGTILTGSPVDNLISSVYPGYLNSESIVDIVQKRAKQGLQVANLVETTVTIRAQDVHHLGIALAALVYLAGAKTGPRIIEGASVPSLPPNRVHEAIAPTLENLGNCVQMKIDFAFIMISRNDRRPDIVQKTGGFVTTHRDYGHPNGMT